MLDQKLLEEVKELITIPVNHNLSSLESEIKKKENLIKKYKKAGFNSIYDNKRGETVKPLEKELRILRGENMLALQAEKYRKLGYLVIQDPKWDGHFGYETQTDFWSGETSKIVVLKSNRARDRIPCKIFGGRKKYDFLLFGWDTKNTNFRALFCAPIDQYLSDVPEFVLDKVIEERKKGIFSQFDIMFVANRDDVLNMVKGITRQRPLDPILIGRLNGTGTETSRQGAVLAMWGDDLEEIDLALLSSNTSEKRMNDNE